MHRGVLELCTAWCGTYHIGVRDWVSSFPFTHCKIAIHFHQKDVERHEPIPGLCACQSQTGKHDTLASTYKELKKENDSNNNAENMSFGLLRRHQALRKW